MTEKTEHAPGTPSWIDVAAPDVDKAAAFYSAVFGWTAEEPGPIEETGGYRMFTINGKNVAGIGPLMDPNQPPTWTTYFTVTDADATMAAVTAGGGTVIVPPMDVMTAGRMAIFSDDTGVVAAVWQPRDHIGAQLADEPGAACWFELLTNDQDQAAKFYGQLFGWTGAQQDMGDGEQYTIFSLGDQMVAGMAGLDPSGQPAHWSVVIAVADCDATIATATANGGTLVTPPMDIPYGRFAGLQDPFGAAFTILQPPETPPA